MPQTTEITFGADVSQAVDAINTLQDRLTGLSRQVRESLQAMRSADAAYVAAFKTNMQIMVDAKQLSLQQALGFDIDYTAKVFEQEQARLAAIRDSDRTALGERLATTEAMRAAEERYVTQISGEYRKLADAARSEADRIARSYEQAFDRIGGTVQRSFNQILTGQTTWAKGMTRITQEVESFFLDQVESMAAKWAASGLASLAGDAVSGAVKGAQATGSNGLGAGLAALLGLNQPGGLLGTGLFSGAGTTATAASEAAAVTANTTALGASTAAMTALTTALGGATAASTAGAGASVAGGATAAGAAAGGGGFFSWLGGLFSFADGGIVPSAAGGWAVPNLAGATPALLHAREMVLPADISQGLQSMIANGGGSGGAGDAHFHAHFHGPADAPAISRWFRDNLKGNAGAIRDLFRQNALTPRSF